MYGFIGAWLEDTPMKPTTTYRQRRDLMLKKFSTVKILDEFTETTRRKGIVIVYKRGRKCFRRRYSRYNKKMEGKTVN